MLALHTSYMTNEAGERQAVIVPIDEWLQIVEALEMLDDIAAYDEACAEKSDPLPFAEAMAEIKAEQVE